MKSLLTLSAVLACTLAAAQPPTRPAAPPCKDVPLTPPPAWGRKDVGPAFSVALPSCFVEEKAKWRFSHGGTTWLCPPGGAEVVWGMWGDSSFGSGDRCTTNVGGVPAVVIRKPDPKGTSLIVWYRTGDIHEPMISAWSPRLEDRESVLQIAFSGRKRTPK